MVIDTIGKKVCKDCGELKDLNDFYNSKHNKSTGKMPRCKECHSFNCHLYYLQNSDKCKANMTAWVNANYKQHRELCIRWQKNNKWIRSYSDARSRAKAKNLPFDLKGKDVKELFKSPKVCAISGKQLKHNKKRVYSDSPCMCRRDFKKGWTKDSVKLISHGEVVKRVANYNRTRTKK